MRIATSPSEMITGKGTGSCATAEELGLWLNGCGLDTSTWGETKEKTESTAPFVALYDS